ncbi:MAG TPA: DNA mismatch repair protein MutT [Ruminiclostridium sp.]|jgi:8-oxo-dGTP pyrophosphatase MutT (NUDIX family)|nr:NUDIX domain-containing protein [Clostridiaceae bacterium]NLM27334.1 NUDIX domain-containing protein [Clostridiaceae bacterium]HAA25722.1 DNA mismatch repair protein MutT [Ruminiclostridium sp.]
MDTEKMIYFAVKALILHEGKFLALHKRIIEEDWLELPGGRMEFGESAEETVIREVFEETGLIVKPVKLLDTWNSVHEDYQITGVIYYCIIENGEVRLSDEHDRYEWLKADIPGFDKLHKAFREKMVNWDWDNLKL